MIRAYWFLTTSNHFYNKVVTYKAIRLWFVSLFETGHRAEFMFTQHQSCFSQRSNTCPDGFAEPKS